LLSPFDAQNSPNRPTTAIGPERTACSSHRTYAIEVGDYFRHLDGDVTRWLFKAAPAEAKAGLPLFQTPRFTRTMSDWLNMLIDAGFRLDRVNEPRPSDATVRDCPAVQDAQVVACFLHVRGRK